jgi:hypothetical protein
LNAPADLQAGIDLAIRSFVTLATGKFIQIVRELMSATASLNSSAARRIYFVNFD